MKTSKWSAPIVFAGAALLSASAAAQPSRECLYYRDLEQLHATSNTTALATTRRDAYTITFLTPCQARSSAAFFILRQPPLGFCVRPGDRFPISAPAPACVVKDITYLRSVRIQDGR
jgi:hypothetical protein